MTGVTPLGSSDLIRARALVAVRVAGGGEKTSGPVGSSSRFDGVVCCGLGVGRGTGECVC